MAAAGISRLLDAVRLKKEIEKWLYDLDQSALGSGQGLGVCHSLSPRPATAFFSMKPPGLDQTLLPLEQGFSNPVLGTLCLLLFIPESRASQTRSWGPCVCCFSFQRAGLLKPGPGDPVSAAFHSREQGFSNPVLGTLCLLLFIPESRASQTRSWGPCVCCFSFQRAGLLKPGPGDPVSAAFHSREQGFSNPVLGTLCLLLFIPESRASQTRSWGPCVCCFSFQRAGLLKPGPGDPVSAAFHSREQGFSNPVLGTLCLLLFIPESRASQTRSWGPCVCCFSFQRAGLLKPGPGDPVSAAFHSREQGFSNPVLGTLCLLLFIPESRASQTRSWGPCVCCFSFQRAGLLKPGPGDPVSAAFHSREQGFSNPVLGTLCLLLFIPESRASQTRSWGPCVCCFSFQRAGLLKPGPGDPVSAAFHSREQGFSNPVLGTLCLLLFIPESRASQTRSWGPCVCCFSFQRAGLLKPGPGDPVSAAFHSREQGFSNPVLGTLCLLLFIPESRASQTRSWGPCVCCFSFQRAGLLKPGPGDPVSAAFHSREQGFSNPVLGTLCLLLFIPESRASQTRSWGPCVCCFSFQRAGLLKPGPGDPVSAAFHSREQGFSNPVLGTLCLLLFIPESRASQTRSWGPCVCCFSFQRAGLLKPGPGDPVSAAFHSREQGFSNPVLGTLCLLLFIPESRASQTRSWGPCVCCFSFQRAGLLKPGPGDPVSAAFHSREQGFSNPVLGTLCLLLFIPESRASQTRSWGPCVCCFSFQRAGLLKPGPGDPVSAAFHSREQGFSNPVLGTLCLLLFIPESRASQTRSWGPCVCCFSFQRAGLLKPGPGDPVSAAFHSREQGFSNPVLGTLCLLLFIPESRASQTRSWGPCVCCFSFQRAGLLKPGPGDPVSAAFHSREQGFSNPVLGTLCLKIIN
ncbi:UNVERIFIED_CONTAM: hypothetical protein FKN15_055099 [Acipenser sinensis]